MDVPSTEVAMTIQAASMNRRGFVIRRISKDAALMVMGPLVAIFALVGLLIPRIPQPQSYHLFADQRTLLGIPHFGDVVSNLPFAVVGIWGLILLSRNSHTKTVQFLDRREAWPYLFFFFGLFLTAFGSTYYHLAPDNARLLWDRLPLTITFMSVVAAVIAERVDLRLGLRLLPILLCVGFASVLQWYWSETSGMGDMRFYAAVQACSGLVLLLALLLPSHYTRGSDLGLLLGFYCLAKALEFLDIPIFTLLHIISGHTLKHLAAAAAGFSVLQMLRKRELLAVVQPQ